MTAQLDPARPDAGDVQAAARLVARFHELEADRAAIVDEQTTIKSQLRALLGQGRHDVGTGHVTVAAPRRTFDPLVALSVIPPHVLPSVVTTVVDRQLAQRMLTPEQYAACQVSAPGAEPVVRIA